MKLEQDDRRRIARFLGLGCYTLAAIIYVAGPAYEPSLRWAWFFEFLMSVFGPHAKELFFVLVGTYWVVISFKNDPTSNQRHS